jgi:hypothetical protein
MKAGSASTICSTRKSDRGSAPGAVHPHVRHGRDGRSLLEERLGEALEGITLDTHSGVDRADEREARCVDAGVQRVGTSEALLVEHAQVVMQERLVHGAHLAARDAPPQRLGEWLELERLLDGGNASRHPVVADDDDFELRIVQVEEGVCRSDHRRHVAARRDDDRHRRLEPGVRRGHVVEGPERQAAKQRRHADQQQQHAPAIGDEEVGDEEPHQRADHPKILRRRIGSSASACASMSAAKWSRAVSRTTCSSSGVMPFSPATACAAW